VTKSTRGSRVVLIAGVLGLLAAIALGASRAGADSGGTAALGGQGFQDIASVTAVDGGFLAVGSEERGSSRPAAAWRGSANGHSWSRLDDLPTLALDGEPTTEALGVTSGDGGTTIAVGSVAETPTGIIKPGSYVPFDALFWRSTDGRNFDLTTKDLAEDGVNHTANAVAFGDATFVAVGKSSVQSGKPACEQPLAWYSTDDGRSWTKANVPVPAGGSGAAHAVAWSADVGFVAVGETYQENCVYGNGSTAAIWISQDGETWQLDALPDGGAAVGVAISDEGVAVVGAGRTHSGDECDAVYWTSVDFKSWRATKPDRTERAAAVTALADGSFVAVGAKCKQPFAVPVAYASTAGRGQWKTLKVDDSRPGLMNAVAPKGRTGFVVVGSEHSNGAAWWT